MSAIGRFVCFVHIERSGGTTLHQILRHGIPGYFAVKPWFYWANEAGAALGERELRLLKLTVPPLRGLGGHTVRPSEDYGRVFGSDPVWLTVLRRPADRYLSHLNYQRLKMGIPWTFDQFASEPRFNNFQTIRLAGEADVGKAIARLDQFDFVGLSEEYAKSVLILSRLLPVRPFNFRINEMPKSNDMITPASLTKEQQERVRHNNELDLRLYEHASKVLFPRFRETYEGDLDADEKAFRETESRPPYSIVDKLYVRLCKRFGEWAAHRLSGGTPSLPAQFSEIRREVMRGRE